MSLNLKKIRESDESQAQPSIDDEQCLDHQLLKKLEDLVEDITTTGRTTLDEGLMKQIKKICKTSDEYVEQAFHLIFNQLQKEHCEIRLSAFQVINELFNRSHHFRELLVTDMQEFLEFAVETDPDSPLPPPKAAAKTLKESAIKAVQEWHNKFGKAYKKLTLGYNFLKFQKKIDFDNIEARSVVERRRAEQRQQRRQLAEQQKVILILQKMQEKIPEMEQSLMQMENCFDLLLPRQTNQSETDSPQHNDDAESDAADRDVLDDDSDTNSLKPTNETDSPHHDDDAESDAGDEDKRDVLADDANANSAKPKRAISNIQKNEKTTGTAVQNSTVKIKQEFESAEDGENGVNDEKDCEAGNQDVPMDTENFGTSSNDGLRQHGLPSREYNLTITLNTDGLHLTENEDNIDILRTLDDHYRLVTSRYIPEIALWMSTLGKTSEQQDKVKKCIDLKLALKGVIEKYKELQRNPSSQEPKSFLAEESDSEDDDEFEDVPEKEGYEPNIPEHLRKEYGLEPLPSTSSSKPTTQKPKPKPPAKKAPTPQLKRKASSTSTHVGLIPSKGPRWHPLMETEHTVTDPTSQAGTMKVLMERANAIITVDRPTSSTEDNTLLDPEKQKLLSKAPKVSFGIDIEHWEDPSKIQAPTILRPDADHLVWSSAYADEEVTLENMKNSMQTRVMSYTGSFTPVKWKCRAPLPSETLCERMDRVKCPFHGRIIARDENGKPANQEEAAQVAKEQKEQFQEQAGPSSSSPFDPELQRDVEAALGLDLGSSNPDLGSSAKGRKGKGRRGKKGKGKGKAKKYPNLTDIKKVKNTSRLRLERKVLNKNALGRVAKSMNTIEKKMHHDRFANNFNYALN